MGSIEYQSKEKTLEAGGIKVNTLKTRPMRGETY
jgi:hypothetical protein